MLSECASAQQALPLWGWFETHGPEQEGNPPEGSAGKCRVLKSLSTEGELAAGLGLALRVFKAERGGTAQLCIWYLQGFFSPCFEQVTIVVLGNKCDLQEQRRVDHDAAQHWAKGEKVKLWEVSVADRRTLIEPFIYLASKMTQPQSKSAFPLSRKNKGSGSMDG